MIKPILPAAALIGASLLLPTAARANDYSGIDHYCYMVDGAGATVDLSSICGMSRPAALPPAALNAEQVETAQGEEVVTELGFVGSMRAAGYNLMAGNLSTSDPTVSYDVWSNRDGLDYLYFIWGSSPGPGLDNRSEPDVVVRFLPTDKVARVTDAAAQACYFSTGSFCDTASIPDSIVVPVHRRSENYAGNCLFPWQSASDGSRCGARAAVVREGGY
ncbi:hypothetical protein C7293_13745 [filamentous cyanobacterium CCT1]|nr:hypothetical protein C7293_13745 [filamentous cyanobacterium CCT1]PSN80385.1 hypothetical protein C8B47_06675 [filamentous cyanobacterium CCP4]